MSRSALEISGMKSRTDHISDRVKGIVVSPIKEMALLATKIPDATPFAWGIPFVETPKHIREALKDALDNDPYLGRYSPSLGLPELKQLVAKEIKNKYGVEADPNSEIMITTGAMEGLMDAFQSIINPGDEVLMTSPGFSSHIEQTLLAGGVPKFLPLLEEKGWAMDLEALPKLITEKTKAIILCSPCNPTGSIFTEAELAVIAELVLKHNLILITDEPYNFLTYDGHRSYSLVADDRLRYNRIACFSFSKEYAMTGYRVGYTFAEPGMIMQMLKVHDATLVSAPRPSQVAAIAALKGSRECVEELKNTLMRRRDLMCSYFDKMSKWFSYVLPAGSYYVFPKFLPAHDDIKQVAVDILNEAHVTVVPGIAFGPDGDGHLRFCFGATEEDIKVGMERLHEWLLKKY